MRILIGAVAVGLLGCVVSCGGRKVRGGVGSVEVRVDLQCDTNSVRASVTPWTARLQQGDSVAWVLDTTAAADSFVVNSEPKKGWPFNENPPYRGTKHGNAKSGGMKSNQNGKSYPYSVTLVCDKMSGPPRTVTIDPEMIIQ